MNFLERLRSPRPLLCVELRPPRIDAGPGESIEAWMEMNSALRRLARRDTVVFLTDRAVGAQEEENLSHLVSNLEPDVPRDGICPFLTTKHTLEYCQWYAVRAVDAGYPSLVVLGGDRHVGPARCVEHAYELRKKIRERFPDLTLGGWANPHRGPDEQIRYLTDESFTAEYYLTQIVSHHDLANVDAFLEKARDVDLPAIFGVFYYRSGRKETLERLEQFMKVPVKGLRREFKKEGLSADEICARSIRALRERGARHVYISNLELDGAAERLEAIEGMVG